jgi:hypothetical protein
MFRVREEGSRKAEGGINRKGLDVGSSKVAVNAAFAVALSSHKLLNFQVILGGLPLQSQGRIS